MSKPAFIPPTTISKILNDCKKSEENIRRLANWVAENPWLDQTSVEYAIPGCATLKFEPHSKAILVEHLGGAGWVAKYSNEVLKAIDGIEFVLRREIVTIFGEIPEAEMKGVK